MIDMVAPAFIGDEMRLRQITSNLVSNALKFTETGGTVRLVTKLIFPPLARTSNGDSAKDGGSYDLVMSDGLHQLRRSFDVSTTTTSRPQVLPRSASSPETSTGNSDKVVVRVEVHDTGVGINAAELVDNNLFSPYVQTEIGRRQGGKGSGLGLALVMQIIKLSKGRLGVDSEIGKGSCFWFEMPYTIPSAGDELPQESRHILLTKPSFLHVMGSPPTAKDGLPKRRDSVASADDYLDSSGEPGSGFRRATFNHPTSMEEITSHSASRHTRAQSSGSFFDNMHGSQLPAIPSSPCGTASPVDPLDAAGEDLKRMSQVPSKDVIDSCPPVSIETRRSLSVSSIPSLPTHKAPHSHHATDMPTDNFNPPPTLSPESPPVMSRNSSDETDILTPEMSPKLHLADLYQPLTNPLSSMSEQSPTTETVPSTSRHRMDQRRRSSGRSLSALVVDDDSLTRRLMSRMLSRLGHMVTTVDNGKKAVDLILENAADNPFDIVFLDNQMPIMTGVEAVAALRQVGNDTYVVGCTGNALREDQDEYLSSGANAIIAKPVHQAAIIEHLAEAKRRSDAKNARNEQ